MTKEYCPNRQKKIKDIVKDIVTACEDPDSTEYIEIEAAPCQRSVDELNTGIATNVFCGTGTERICVNEIERNGHKVWRILDGQHRFLSIFFFILGIYKTMSNLGLKKYFSDHFECTLPANRIALSFYGLKSAKTLVPKNFIGLEGRDIVTIQESYPKEYDEFLNAEISFEIFYNLTEDEEAAVFADRNQQKPLKSVQRNKGVYVSHETWEPVRSFANDIFLSVVTQKNYQDVKAMAIFACIYFNAVNNFDCNKKDWTDRVDYLMTTCKEKDPDLWDKTWRAFQSDFRAFMSGNVSVVGLMQKWDKRYNPERGGRINMYSFMVLYSLAAGKGDSFWSDPKVQSLYSQFIERVNKNISFEIGKPDENGNRQNILSYTAMKAQGTGSISSMENAAKLLRLYFKECGVEL